MERRELRRLVALLSPAAALGFWVVNALASYHVAPEPTSTSRRLAHNQDTSSHQIPDRSSHNQWSAARITGIFVTCPVETSYDVIERPKSVWMEYISRRDWSCLQYNNIMISLLFDRVTVKKYYQVGLISESY